MVWDDLPDALQAALIDQGYSPDDVVSIEETGADKYLLRMVPYRLVFHGQDLAASLTGTGAPVIEPSETEIDVKAEMETVRGVAYDQLTADVDTAVGAKWAGGDAIEGDRRIKCGIVAQLLSMES